MKKLIFFIMSFFICLSTTACSVDPQYNIYIASDSNAYTVMQDEQGYYIEGFEFTKIGHKLKEFTYHDVLNDEYLVIDSTGRLKFEWLNEKSLTFTIVWEVLTYKVVYNLEGGSLRGDDISLYFYIDYLKVMPEPLDYNDLRLPGYYFYGWFSKRTGRGDQYSNDVYWLDSNGEMINPILDQDNKPTEPIFNEDNFSDLFNNLEVSESGELILNLYAYWTTG